MSPWHLVVVHLIPLVVRLLRWKRHGCMLALVPPPLRLVLPRLKAPILRRLLWIMVTLLDHFRLRILPVTMFLYRLSFRTVPSPPVGSRVHLNGLTKSPGQGQLAAVLLVTPLSTIVRVQWKTVGNHSLSDPEMMNPLVVLRWILTDI